MRIAPARILTSESATDLSPAGVKTEGKVAQTNVEFYNGQQLNV